MARTKESCWWLLFLLCHCYWFLSKE